MTGSENKKRQSHFHVTAFIEPPIGIESQRRTVNDLLITSQLLYRNAEPQLS